MKVKEIYEMRSREVNGELMKAMGWESCKEAVETVHARLISLLKVIRSEEESLAEEFFENVSFEGKNERDVEYGRYYERMVFENGRQAYTVIYNMSTAGQKYVIYHTGKATPVQKCRSQKEVARFLLENLTRGE